MNPDAHALVEHAIAAFVVATIWFDFDVAERAANVAFAATNYVDHEQGPCS